MNIIEEMAVALDVVFAPAFTLVNKPESSSDSSHIFKYLETPLQMRVSAAESAFSLILYQTQAWKRSQEDLIEICEQLNQRGREYHYAIGDAKADSAELRVKAWAGHELGSKNWESVLITLVDSMLRDFTFVVQKLLNEGPVQLPLSAVSAHPFARQIWTVITFFEPKEYTLVCDDSGSGHFNAHFNFSHNHKRVSSQRLKVRYTAHNGNLRISIVHRDEGKVTKANLQDLNLRSNELKIEKGRLTAGVNVRLEAPILNGVLYVAQRFTNVLGVLMEVGVLKGKLPFPASKILYTPEADPNFELFLGDFEQLRPKVFDLVSTFVPPPYPQRWSFPSFREVCLPSNDQYNAILSKIQSVRSNLRFSALLVHPELLHFDPERRTILTDLSGLKPAAEMQTQTQEGFKLYGYMEELLGTMADLNKVGLEMIRVKETWYEDRSMGRTVVVPDIAENRFSIETYQGGMGEVEGLEAISRLEPYLQQLNFEHAMDLAVKIKSHVDRTREQPSIVDSLSAEDTEIANFPTETSSIALASLLRRLWWNCTQASIASSPQSLVQTTGTEGIQLGIRRIITPKAVKFAALPVEGQDIALERLYRYLERTQNCGVAHLMLRPEVVFYILENSTVEVRDPQFSVYNLRKMKNDSLAIQDLDYLDPSVVSYIQWKCRCHSFKTMKVTADQYEALEAAKVSTKLLESKCRKYFRRITPKSDIYSFAMLLYAQIWRTQAPFDYVHDLVNSSSSFTLEEFYHYVVKPHRRPIISERFEDAFPLFTETLRRCFMKPESRPSLKELYNFIGEISKFRLFVEEERQKAVDRSE